jgi:hypothetical protein
MFHSLANSPLPRENPALVAAVLNPSANAWRQAL